MRRSARGLVAAGSVGLALLLGACDRPAPKITVQTGGFSTTVAPSDYFFDAQHHRSAALDLPTVASKSGESVLVDVPRDVVDHGWSVTAISLDTKHTVLGRSGVISDSHSYRVAAQSNNGDPFIVQVTQLRQGQPDGSVWSFLVKVSDST